jgi:hypothetical protein
VEIVDTVMWVCIVLGVVLGIPFTLLWWRDMDKWADADSKKFKPKEPKPTGPKVVIRMGDSKQSDRK